MTLRRWIVAVLVLAWVVALFITWDRPAGATPPVWRESWCRVGHPHYDPAMCGTTTTAPTTTTTAPTTTTTAAPTTTTTTAPTTTTTATTTTTTAPTTTTTAPPGACVGVQVPAGSNLNTYATAHPSGTTFCLAAGTFAANSISPKASQKWVGALGSQGQRLSVITGNDTVRFMLQCPVPANCVGLQFKNFILEHFAPGPQQNPIQGGGSGWLIDNIESRFNAGIGLGSPDGTTVRNSYIHHNTQMGAHGQGDNALWENNEIAYNNPNQLYDVNWEAGGLKFVNAVNSTFRGNYVHDNCGHGIWYDGFGNTGELIENNRVVRNSGYGIFWELTDGTAVIRNNYVEANALGLEQLENGQPNTVCTSSSGIFGIYFSDSENADIYGNVLVNNEGGIGGQQSDRNPTRNHSVHDNDMTYQVGWSGFRCNAGICVENPNIRFENNDYHIPTLSGTWWGWRPLLTGTLLKTWSQWQALGFDDTGSVD